METETLRAMNEGIYLSALIKVIEVIGLIAILFAIVGLAVYLISIAWFCFEETRQSANASRKARSALSVNTRNSEPRALRRRRSPLIISEVTFGPLQPQPSLIEIRRNER
ncbi:MAG TPA: hypothetical protein VID27_17335 [Blastocatellia bacterium]|jgi:hypothetical protein